MTMLMTTTNKIDNGGIMKETNKIDAARERMIARMTGKEESPVEKSNERILNDAVDKGIGLYMANRNNAMPVNADSARERMIATMKHDSRTHKPIVISDPEKPTNNFMSSEAARSRMLSRMTAR